VDGQTINAHGPVKSLFTDVDWTNEKNDYVDIQYNIQSLYIVSYGSHMTYEVYYIVSVFLFPDLKKNSTEQFFYCIKFLLVNTGIILYTHYYY
jgi:hypothetical protein